MSSPKYIEERKKVMIGKLPDDFLRVPSQNQEQATNVTNSTTNGSSSYLQTVHQQQIIICIVQAQLAKNYSLTKMDPYVKIRIGHTVFETLADIRGGKLPNWNKTISTFLPNGIKTLHIEVFDERTITPDERIAYADYVISDEVLQGKFIDTWIPLSGKQGIEKEGSINVTICVKPMPYWPSMVVPQPLMFVPQAQPGQFPYYVQSPYVSVKYHQQPMQNPNYAYPVNQLPQPPPQPYRPSEEEIKQVQEMFPVFDREVILSVLVNSQGNKDQAINSLLTLSSDK